MFSDFYHSFYYSALILTACISLLLLHKADPPFRWLALLVIITVVSECIAKYLGYKYGNNSIDYHIFTPIEYFFYANIFYRFFKHKKWSVFLISSVVLLVLLEFLNTKYLQSLQEDNTNIMMLENILLVFLSLMLFVNIRTSHTSKNILLEGVFWFNSIVLIYYTFNILITGFQGLKVYQFKDPPMVIYEINLLLSAILYLIYALAIILNVMHKRKTVTIHE